MCLSWLMLKLKLNLCEIFITAMRAHHENVVVLITLVDLTYIQFERGCAVICIKNTLINLIIVKKLTY